MLYTYDNSGDTTIESLHEKLRFSCESYKVAKEVSIDSKDTLIMIACQADFKRGPMWAVNHYIPAWSKKQCDRQAWLLCNEALLDKLSDAKADAAFLLIQNMNDDFDASVEQARVDSVTSLKSLLEKQQAAIEFFNDMELTVEMVPADGNCALWSFYALTRGIQPRDAKGSACSLEAEELPPLKMVSDLREEFCLHIDQTYPNIF